MHRAERHHRISRSWWAVAVILPFALAEPVMAQDWRGWDGGDVQLFAPQHLQPPAEDSAQPARAIRDAPDWLFTLTDRPDRPDLGFTLVFAWSPTANWTGPSAVEASDPMELAGLPAVRMLWRDDAMGWRGMRYEIASVPPAGAPFVLDCHAPAQSWDTAAVECEEVARTVTFVMPVQDDPGPATDSAAVPAETAVLPTPTDEPEPVLPYSIDAPGQSDAPPPFDTAVVWRAPDPGPAPEPTDSPVWQADPIPIATDLTPAQTHDDGQDAAADPDSFTPQDAGYVLYQNARFGTFLAYPSATFAPDPAPDNGDGRRFTSHDGSAEVLVWSQYNSMGQTSTDLLAQARGSIGLTQEVLGNAQEGLYEVEGAAGELHVYEKGIVEGPDGLIRVFRISFPQARFDEFAPIAAAMIASFGPGTSL